MWALLLVAAVAAVQGAQYGDYGAVKMPAYGEYEAPRDSPLDYLPSAATSLDYKDDGDIKVTQKSLNKEYGNGDSWQKPSRKQSKRFRNDEDYSEVQGRRSRDNNDRKYRDDLDGSIRNEKSRDVRARVKHKRDQRDDDDEFSIEKYIRGINENNLEVDVNRGRKTTDRIVRRKPRDRDLGKTDAAFKEDDFDEELRANTVRPRVPGPGLKEIEGPVDIPSDSEEFMPRSSGGRDLDVMPIEEMRRSTEEPSYRRGYDQPPRLRPAQRARLDTGGASAGAPSDYESDYYDLKRLQSMRKKMPGYRQRTEANDEDWAPSEVEKLRELESRRLMNAAGRRTTTQAELPPRRPSVSETTTTTTHTTSTATTTAVTTSSEPTLTPAQSGKIPSETGKNEISLAEKSRLSILKKAGQKERQKGGPLSTKPPVLLHVTKQVPTVVLVEASTSGDPWMRAREVHEDSQENLALVRQLMRNKLVANAKDIRDLTEDWDQLVCDYVDVSLLSNRAGPGTLNLVVLLISYPMLCLMV